MSEFDKMNRWANGMRGGAVHMADGGIISRMMAPFRPPPGYVSAKQEAAAAAAARPASAPAAAAPSLGSVNTGAISRREAAAGLRSGGVIGGKRNGNKDTVDAKLTPGEGVLPVDTVDALGGPEAVQDLIDATHTPVGDGVRGGFNDGGFPGYDPRRTLQARPNFTIPNGPPAMEPQLRLPAPTPSTALVPDNRPNFTMPGNEDVFGESRGGRFNTAGAADAAAKPNFGTSASPEAQFARSQADARAAARAAVPPVSPTAAPPVTPSAPTGVRGFFTGGAPGGVGGAFRSVGGAVGAVGDKLLRGAVRVAPGAAAAGAAYSGFNTGTDTYEQRLGIGNGPPADVEGDFYGRNGPVPNGVRMINDMGVRALGIAGDVAGASGATTEAYRKRYGTETTDPTLLGDVANRGLGVVEDVARQWTGNDLVNKLTGGAIGFAPRNDGYSGVRAKATAPGAAKVDPANLSARYNFPDTAGGGRGRVNPSRVNPELELPTNGKADGQVMDFDPTIRRMFKGGKTLYTNVAGDNASMFSTGQPSAQNIGAADAISNRDGLIARATAQAQIDTANGLRGEPRTLREKLLKQFEGKQMTAKGAAALARAEEIDATREENGVRNALTARGQDLVAGAARVKARQDQAQSDRTYNFEREKFAQTSKEAAARMTDAERTASAAADKAVQSNLESRFRSIDKNGNSVPDNAKIAEFRTALDTTIPQMVKQLQAVGTPAALAKANDLVKHKAGALEPGDLADLHQMFDFRARAAEAKGILPGSGSYVHSDNLLDYRQRGGKAGVEKRTFGGDRVITANGTEVSENDLKYQEGLANKFLPDFKTRSTNLTRGLRTD